LGKVGTTKGDEAPWLPVKKKGKLGGLGASSPALFHDHPFERSTITLSPASADEQPLKHVKILYGSAEAPDLQVRATNRFSFLQGLGDDILEALAAMLSPCDSSCLLSRELELVFSTSMEMQPQPVPSTPEEKLAKAPVPLECGSGSGLRVVKSWIRMGKLKDKGKGKIGRPTPGLATSLSDRGMKDVSRLWSTNVSRDLFEEGQE
jgi:hypothetical protein